MISGMFVIPEKHFFISGIGIGVGTGWSILLYKQLLAKKILPIIILFFCSFVVGFWRVDQFHRHYPFDAFDQYNNQTITLVGVVADAPIIKPGSQSVRIHPQGIDGEKMPEESRDIFLKVSDLETFNPGDQVVVSGKFSLRENFLSETGRTVQYRLMSYSKRIAGDISFPKIIEHIPDSKNPLIFFVTIKNKFVTTLQQLFLDPAAGLLAGIMIGDTSNLTGNFLDMFRAVGLIHIVVLSGYNITLIAGVFSKMFAPMGYFRRIVAAVIALVLFIAVVGISQTALRAGIMALAAFAAHYFVRPYAVTRAIFLALIIMVWTSPYALLFDLSLQLSFLATFGIVYIFPLLQEKYSSLIETEMGEIFLQTIAVNILTLPIIVYQMGYFSLLSFPVNIAVLGFMPLLTVGGFIAVVIGIVNLSLGKLVAFPLQVITDSIIKLVTWSANHDPFKISVPMFSLTLLISMYLLIGCWVFKQLHKKPSTPL